MDMVKMGRFLAELRKEHHFTQAELGEKLGVTNKTISRWETGNYMPPVEMLEQLSTLYDLSINELLCGKKLTAEEYTIMKTHVENSVGIIRHLPSLDYVIPAVISHHERYDGKGYPRGLAGENIPLMGRMLCVVDSFDAMISRRSYKKAMSVEKALSILSQERGAQFDPKLADLFIQLVVTNQIEIHQNK